MVEKGTATIQTIKNKTSGGNGCKVGTFSLRQRRKGPIDDVLFRMINH